MMAGAVIKRCDYFISHPLVGDALLCKAAIFSTPQGCG
jgi:hypothetical protein